MAATQPYLSPKRFALGGYGIDISTIKAVALRSTLRRASTLVDTWCNGSVIPTPFDFRGGEVIGEQHVFPIPNPLLAYPGSRRIFVYQRPLRTVTGFRLKFTNSYQITLPPSNLFVNSTEGWAEIVASQPTIIGYPPLGYWYGLFQPIAEIDYTYGHRIAVTEDECEAASPTLYYATYGNWLSRETVEVQIDGAVESSGYSVNLADGSITFVEAPAPDEVVSVSYVTTLPDAIAQATGLIAVDLLGQARIAARGMIGLQSIKVAEVALTQMHQSNGQYVARNGISIPSSAAAFLAPFAGGSAA
jgi:hypothetical protein